MAENRNRYTAAYRRDVVAKARRTGRSPDALACELKPSAGTIRRWIRQAELDDGRRTDGLTTRQQTAARGQRKEVRQLRRDRDILLAMATWFLGGGRISSQDRFAFVKAHSELPVRAMCRLLGVSSSGYYAWLTRPPSARARRDAVLRRQVYLIWRASRQTYGRRRIHADLKARGERVSPKRIARLMVEMGITGSRRRRRKRTVPTRRRPAACPAPDLVNRNFHAARRNELWVADITQVPTQAGHLYLSVVLDAWSRLVVGWAAETHVRSELVERALAMAVQRRRPTSVVHHSDRGSQYASHAFGQHCQGTGVRLSMGAPGNSYDNAMCESFLATLNRELLSRSKFATPETARTAIADFIECFYNRRRRHSALDYDSPAGYELRHGM